MGDKDLAGDDNNDMYENDTDNKDKHDEAYRYKSSLRLISYDRVPDNDTLWNFGSGSTTPRKNGKDAGTGLLLHTSAGRRLDGEI